MTKKTQADILKKLNISTLNSMQRQAISVIDAAANTILLSPTGTGKTLAFLLPVLKKINPNIKGVQVLILVPSRELAIQIEQVIREMGAGIKVNAVYGGRAATKDRNDLKHAPSILIGTPGRLSDHIAREDFNKTSIHTLVLDEFDKSLEIGFEKEMKRIIAGLHNLKKRILTSATNAEIPAFVGMTNPKTVNFVTEDASSQLSLQKVLATDDDKGETLIELLHHIGNEQVIIFCNFKDSLSSVSDILASHNLSFSCFVGGMEQRDRERSLIKFRNGSSRILLTTDLAARGIDIPSMKYLIHFELPPRLEEFTHRNGRTARADESGTAFVIHASGEREQDFTKDIPVMPVSECNQLTPSNWETLFISGGRKDKISKGDIAGLFFKKGGLDKTELGVIELKQDCAFVAVPANKSQELIKTLNNTRLKNRKVRITLA
ncbi:MAG: DEAD/DEAH box helicase [Gammaproteobacteria bacterium]|nr:DEAD/DEAH box helicase [Gammaproteobacteria bacterium]